MNWCHPAVAMHMPLKAGVFLWVCSSDAQGMQDTVEIWADNVYAENVT